ncbi:MAG: Mobile element protein, partial [uncultured Chloroflexia bacterium]
AASSRTSGQNAGWAGHEDRREGRGPHLRLVRQPAAGSPSGPHQGAVGL